MRSTARAIPGAVQSKTSSSGSSGPAVPSPVPLATPILRRPGLDGNHPMSFRSWRNRTRFSLQVATAPESLAFGTQAHRSCWAAALLISSACFGLPEGSGTDSKKYASCWSAIGIHAPLCGES